jgi:MFS family permease
VLLQGFAPSLAVLGGARFIAFISSSSLEPAILSILSKITPREKRGIAYGWTATFRSVGMLLAAGSGGFLVYHAGVRSTFIVAGLGFLLLIPAIIFVDKQIQKTTPADAGE